MRLGVKAALPSPTQPCGLDRPSPALRALRERVLSAAMRVRGLVSFGLCALVLSLALVACGKRNAPLPPPDEPNTFPRPYPSE
jgi:hypothetical protein